MGNLESGEGKQILLRALFDANRILKLSIIESLQDSGIVWIHRDRKRFLYQSILQDKKEWLEMQKMQLHAQNLNEKRLVRLKNLFEEALSEEMQRTRRLVLEKLVLYSSIPLLRKAVETLKTKDFAAYAGAVSCLQDVLPKKLYRIVREILMYPTVSKDLSKDFSEDELMSPNIFLNSFIFGHFAWSTPWLKALALYGWRMMNQAAGIGAVTESLKSTDWIVLETALFTLGRLEKNKEKVEEITLSIPTRYLLKQNFQALLEGKNVDHH